MNHPARLTAHRAAQAYVEYGLIVAVVAILVVLGLNALSLAEQGYFGGLQGVVAPPLPPPPSQPPNEPTAIASVTCDLSSVPQTCNAVVTNTSLVHAFGAPRGTLYFDAAGWSSILQCTVNSDASAPPYSGTCSIPVLLDPASASVLLSSKPDVSVQYYPTPSAIATKHLKSPWTNCGFPYNCSS
jgi:Flp pilus assembly pilin Flp